MRILEPAPLRTLPTTAQGALQRIWAQWFTIARDTINDHAARVDAGLAANRPTSYNPSDAGKTYYATDTKALSVWDGAAWASVTLT